MEDVLLTSYAPDAEPPAAVAPDGKITDPNAHWTVGHAQRVAEGANLEIHRNTWRYNQVIEAQRGTVLKERDRVLRGDTALTTLAKRCPERHTELIKTVEKEVLVEAARQIALYHLDRCWAEHMAFLADLREGIHLRALGRGMNPLSEFEKEAIRSFPPLLEEAATRSAKTFETVTITDDGADLEGAGLRRPTSTWTYLVQDNPFGSEFDRALKSVAGMVRKLTR